MEDVELAPGLRRWTAPHPEWSEGEDWPREVGCVSWEGEDALCLVDPLVPASEEARLWDRLDVDVARVGLPVVVLVTIGFHERSAAEVAGRYAARLLRPPLTRAELPAGVRAFPAGRSGSRARQEEAVLWLEPPRAVVVGDALLGDPLRVSPWLDDEQGRARTVEALSALLDLPVELVVTSHGSPTTADAREALRHALAA